MSSLATQSAARERASLADVCGQPIKAEHRPHTTAPLLREVAAIAVEHTAIQKEAADQIGIHRARLSHKLKDGSLTLAQLETLGAAYGAELGRLLTEAYGPLALSPEQHTEALIDRIQADLNEVRQFVRSGK